MTTRSWHTGLVACTLATSASAVIESPRRPSRRPPPSRRCTRRTSSAGRTTSAPSGSELEVLEVVVARPDGGERVGRLVVLDEAIGDTGLGASREDPLEVDDTTAHI